METSKPAPSRRVAVVGSAPVKKAAKKTAEKRAEKVAAAPGLKYPSTILGIPAGAPSRHVERALAFRKEALANGHRKAVEKANADAAAKISPLAAEERAEVIAVKESYRADILEADREYDKAVRAAQSERDRQKADAAEARDFCLKSATDSFRNASAPIEQGLKQAVFLFGEDLTRGLEEATAEADVYYAAHRKIEIDRTAAIQKVEDEARAKVAAAAKAATPPGAEAIDLSNLTPDQRRAVEGAIADRERNVVRGGGRRAGLGMALVASALALGGGVSPSRGSK